MGRHAGDVRAKGNVWGEKRRVGSYAIMSEEKYEKAGEKIIVKRCMKEICRHSF